MLYRGTIGAISLTMALSIPLFGAHAFDDSKYPDWKGQWMGGWIRPAPGVTGQPSYDPRKSDGRGQEAPLTPEYQAIFEASLNDQAQGGQGNDPRFTCIPTGMPRIISVNFTLEIVPVPKIT